MRGAGLDDGWFAGLRCGCEGDLGADQERRRGPFSAAPRRSLMPAPPMPAPRRQRARLRATTPRVADLDSLPSPRSLSMAAAASAAATPRRPPSKPASRPGSLPTSPAAPQHLASPGRAADGGGSSSAKRFFRWRALTPNSLLPQPTSQLALAAAAANGDGAVSNGDAAAAASDGDETAAQPTWHHLPSSAGERGGGGGGEHALQEEALWQPPDAATLAERFPATLCLPPPPPEGRLARLLGALHDRTGFTGEHAALALQLAVAMAAACSLHVVQASYHALHEKTIW